MLYHCIFHSRILNIYAVVSQALNVQRVSSQYSKMVGYLGLAKKSNVLRMQHL